MKFVGVSACPSDANDKVRNVCDIILKEKGGRGAVRQFVDDYLLS